MHSWKRFAPLALCSAIGLSLMWAPRSIAQDDKEARGKYLVEEVAKCQACHTPMVATGELDQTKWLKGSTLAFQPIDAAQIKGWHKTAPDLTPGSRLWTRWGEKGLTTFLTTGLGPTGNKADPPMPTYKMRPEDAEAVVAYLKSLK